MDTTEATEYTYEDAGRVCGCSAETIRHRAKRGKLRRGRPTNTGRPTVILSEQDIAAISAGRPANVQPGGQTPGQPGGQPPEESLAVKALAGALTDAQEARRRAEEATEAERRGRDEDRRAADEDRRAADEDRRSWAARLDDERRGREAAEADRRAADAARSAAEEGRAAAVTEAAALGRQLAEARRPWLARLLSRGRT